MRVQILGSSAGGGFPQWNCNCPNCAGWRSGRVRAQARTQSSICVQGDVQAHPQTKWVLVNASPDVLAQIRATPALHPRTGLRDSGIGAVILCDGQIDHTTGLYMLRERTGPLPLWCTDPVYEDLTRGNPILNVLGHYCGVDRHDVPIDGRHFSLPLVPGLDIEALSLSSQAAPYSPHRGCTVPGDNVGLTFTCKTGGGKLFYAPGLGERTPEVDQAMRRANCVLVDGTFWRDDEMQAMGLSQKTARDIGHLPQSGAGGMIEWLCSLPQSTRKILIHINNTNPILDEDSPERAELTRLGIEVACDGMEIQIQ